jgi:hypothetical protein
MRRKAAICCCHYIAHVHDALVWVLKAFCGGPCSEVAFSRVKSTFMTLRRSVGVSVPVGYKTCVTGSTGQSTYINWGSVFLRGQSDYISGVTVPTGILAWPGSLFPRGYSTCTTGVIVSIGVFAWPRSLFPRGYSTCITGGHFSHSPIIALKLHDRGSLFPPGYSHDQRSLFPLDYSTWMTRVIVPTGLLNLHDRGHCFHRGICMTRGHCSHGVTQPSWPGSLFLRWYSTCKTWCNYSQGGT